MIKTVLTNNPTIFNDFVCLTCNLEAEIDDKELFKALKLKKIYKKLKKDRTTDNLAIDDALFDAFINSFK